MKFLPFLFALCNFATAVQSQTLWQFFSARDFLDQPNGPAKSARIRDLEFDNWKNSDTLIDLDQKMRIHTQDLAPFIDEQGDPVFLVPEVSPVFPGGTASFKDYLQNALGDILAGPNEGVQNTLFVKYVIQTDGSVGNVMLAQPAQEWIRTEMLQRCLEAIRQMPPWTPGQYRGRPVKVAAMMDFGFKE